MYVREATMGEPVGGCTVSVTDARDNLSDTINRVQYGKERVVICRREKPAAAVVPMEDKELLDGLEELIDLRAARDALREIGNRGTVSWDDFRKEPGL